DLGRLAPGAKADILLIDLGGRDTPRFGPLRGPIKALGGCGVGDDVVTGVVGGVNRMRDRGVPRGDPGPLRAGGQGGGAGGWGRGGAAAGAGGGPARAERGADQPVVVPAGAGTPLTPGAARLRRARRDGAARRRPPPGAQGPARRRRPRRSRPRAAPGRP